MLVLIEASTVPGKPGASNRGPLSINDGVWSHRFGLAGFPSKVF